MVSLTYIDAESAETPGLPIAYRCLDAAGERLGEVAGVLVDQSTQSPHDLVVRTGNWLTEREYVLPADRVTARDDDEHTLVLGTVTKDALKGGQFPEYRAGEWTGDSRPGPSGTAAGAAGGQRLELRAEALRAAAVPYEAGRVRIGKRVVEREETLTVPLRDEILVIEHVGGEGSVRIGDRELGPGETMELVLYHERAEVQKVVEQREAVSIRKETVQREEQVRASVRHEELEVREGSEFLTDTADATAPVAPSPAEKPSPLPSQARTRPG